MRKQNLVWAVWSVSRITVILFIVFEGNIMSHLNNEPPRRPYEKYYDSGCKYILLHFNVCVDSLGFLGHSLIWWHFGICKAKVKVV